MRSSEGTLAASNRTADLVDEGKFHAEVAVLTIGQAAARLVERRDDAFFGGGRSRSAGTRKRARRSCTIAMLSYVGGAFGSKGTMTPRTALIALAAQRLNRPVKLVASRAQGLTIATYRAGEVVCTS